MYSYFIRYPMMPPPVPASEASKAVFPRNLRPPLQARWHKAVISGQILASGYREQSLGV